jgi:hypothetical protein
VYSYLVHNLCKPHLMCKGLYGRLKYGFEHWSGQTRD